MVSERSNACNSTSRCRRADQKNAKGEWVKKVYDNVKAFSSLKGKISDMKVMEDFESRPHKAVTFCRQKGTGEARLERAKNCQRCYRDVAEECYQEEAMQKHEGNKTGGPDPMQSGD